jgi:hypothetical protein
MNSKLQDIEYVKILAGIEAQKTHVDQAIYESSEKRYRIFKFSPTHKWKGKVVAVVRYTPKDKRRKVLRDNGNGEFESIKSKPRRKSRGRKAD